MRNKLVRLVMLLSCCALATASFSQNGIRRIRQYGTTVENTFESMIMTLDKGYLCWGYTTGQGYAKLVKYDTALNRVWDHVTTWYEVNDVYPTPDSGYVCTGRAKWVHQGSDDVMILKLNKTGGVEWQKMYGGNRYDEGEAVTLLPNGNYLVYGHVSSTDGDVIGKTTTDYDVWMLEFDTNGNLVNQKIYGGPGSEGSDGSMEATSDGGFIIITETNSNGGHVTGNHGNMDAWVLKLDNNYNFQWAKCFGGAQADYGRRIKETQGGYIICGPTGSINGDFSATGTGDGYIAKIDPVGNIIWSRVVGGTGIDDIRGIAIASNNDILVSGLAATPLPEIPWFEGRGPEEAIVLRLDPSGNTIWTRAIGSSSFEWGNDILEAVNGNIIVAGMNWMYSTDGDFAGINAAGGENRGFIAELVNMNTIRGIAFNDANNNNVQDAGESLFTSGSARTTKGTAAITNPLTNGRFLISVDTGAYTTRIINTGLDTTQFRAYPKSKQTVFNGYGQTDSFAFRVIPAALIKDLDISVVRLSNNIYIDHGVKYRIRIKNLGGAAIAPVDIKMSMGGKAGYHSSSIPVHTIAGDTITWQFASFAGFRKDSIDVILKTGTLPVVSVGDSLKIAVVADPRSEDTDPGDNIAFNNGVITGQNSAISNMTLVTSVSDSARLGRPIQYTALYNFQSLLDSTKGSITVLKSHLTTYVSAIPAPSLVNGDTLRWLFKDLAYANQDTIRFTLRVNDAPAANTGDFISHQVRLFLNTVDNSSLFLDRYINQRIRGSYVAPDTITTPLAHPYGIRWSRVYGGSLADWALDVDALQDTGFLAAGRTYSNNGDLPGSGNGSNLQGYVTRFDKDGRVVWKKILSSWNVTEIWSVRKINSQTFYAAGSASQRPGWIGKFQMNGDTVWTRTLDGIVRSVFPLADGGCLLTGDATLASIPGYVNPSQGVNNANVWVAKLDQNGNLLWQKCFSDGVVAHMGTSVIASLDGQILVGGYTQISGATSNPIAFHGLLMKLDAAAGVKIWERKFAGANYMYDVATVLQSSDSSIYLSGAGGVYSGNDTAFLGTHGGQDVWMTKLDKTGQKIWEKFFGGSGTDLGRKMNFSSDGDLLVAASTNSTNGNVTNLHVNSTRWDAWALRIDTSGKLLWQKTIGGNEDDGYEAIVELADRNVLAAGFTNTNNNGDIHGFHGTRDALFTKLGTANFIVGKVYYDENNNGVQDANEPARTNGLVQAVKGNLSFGANPTVNGYSFSVDTGQYVVRLFTADTAYFNIVPASATVQFDNYGQLDTVDFRLVRKADIQDLRVDILPLSVTRPGFQSMYTVKYENKGTVNVAPATLKFIKDHKTDFVRSSVPVSSQNGDTLIWNIPALNIFTTGSINVELRVRTIATNGDSIRTHVEIHPITGDTTPLNNKARIAQVVQGSYDPNDKVELHSNGFAANQLTKEYLTYVIRFQNTGTDTAFNVFIRDTLDAKLEWSSFEMIGASHNYQLSIQDGNKLEWYFSNILLVDSNRNEPASHGFVAFRIKPKGNLQVGDTIRNTASIYFDFNLPVKTNVAATVIVLNSALPSTILDFKAASLPQKKVEVNWTVQHESKVSHYVVEHSVNGSDFTDAGIVRSVNSSGRYTYRFVHKPASDSINYYRLRIVDVDNTYAYSKIVALRNAGVTGAVIVYPNPARQAARLTVNKPVKGQAEVSIMDMSGKVLMRRKLGPVDQPVLEVTVSLEGIPQGTYIVRLQVGENVYQGRIVKQ